MLLYYLFWMFMGFIMHFYIIFGTNLLTQSPVPDFVFPLFQCFAEKEYQTESKQNETFGRVIFGTNEIQEHNRSGVPPSQASVATKNQSVPCSGALPEGGSLTGGHLHHPGALHDEEGVVHPRG